ncbi:methyl-accepting chemotaxis protein [Pseudanabaena sp. lw0831]|nr:methyl-accepting chemotaxis protein [Pseudanabaena sp. lw0831]
MGLGLLLIAIGTSLIGLGGLGYWFYQELLSSARREVDTSAEAQTRQIESKLLDVRQTVDEVASGAKILFQQPSKPKGSEPYQSLIVDGLQNKKSIAGMGIASNSNLLFTPTKPLVPYVWREQSGLKTETSGQKLAAPNDKLLSGDRPDIQKAPFYQDTLKGKASWSQPYTALGKTIITYSAPISDGQKVLGIVNADAIASELLSLIDTASYQEPPYESKFGFLVASSSGQVITASSQFQATQTKNPEVAAVLTSLTQQAKAKPSGIVQTGGYLWAYRKIQGSDLLFVAQLSEAEITNKLMLPVGVAAVSISAILAIAILLFVNSLKKRLKPLTEECDRYLSQQGNSGVNIAGKDEIDRLGLSLKNTFQQVKNNEIRLRGGLNQPLSSDDDISTAAQIQQNFAETELMEAEVGNLLDVVSSMEEGDLTIEAQVNDRATGLVADTLNRLREKLVEIISSVLGTAKQVAKGAADLEELAKTVVLNTAEQAQSVAQGQALTEQVAAIAERSASQVNVANQSLQEVRDTVASGQTAIIALTDSISVLQTGSAQIVQRMKTLGEFVGLAEQFVQDQGQIASLTQVLALNATLVAARAAEQKDPKQFASVAREFESIAGQVNDLATQTNDGLTVLQQRTSQIQTVVTAIDAEVQNLSGLVSGFTSGVESSQSAFNSIQMATEEVVQIGQTITESSTEIADAAGSTASYMSEIAQLADRTANLTRSARQQAEAMGNQAQQLLQGIQFFRLPETSGLISPDTSVNSLFDPSTELSNTETNRDLGVVVPVIAVAAAATAVSLSQSEQALPNEYEVADHEDNTATDSRYLENLLDDDASSDLIEDNAAESPQEQSFDSVSENFMSGDITDRQNQDSATYSNLTDISLIEESLFADLKQEIYDDSSLDESSSLDDTEPALKNQMEGVNEFSIVEASSDPLIVSATSSFLEDTAFGTVTPLVEDSNLSLPTFVDFSIPDMDDDDFIIPKMNIESTLDDSNSFFDNGNSIQAHDVNQAGEDFDPFAMDDQTVFQTIGDVDDSAIVDNDNVFELTSSNISVSVSDPENIAENFEFKEFEDYSQFTSDDAINESLEGSIENSSNEAFSDSFDASFDESPFDRALDETLNDSLDEPFAVAEDVEESLPEAINDELIYELSGQDPNDVFNLEQPVDIYSNNLENQVELSELPTQIPDIYLEESLDDEFSDEFNFAIDDDPLTNYADSVESDEFNFAIDDDPLTNYADSVETDNFFDATSNQGDERFGEEIVGIFDDRVNDEVVSAIVPELEITSSPSIDVSAQSSTEFTFEINESLSMEPSDLVEFDGFSESSSDGFFDGSPINESDELDSIWQTEESVSDESDFSAAVEASEISANEQISEPFDFSINLLEEDVFAAEIAIASEIDIPEAPMLVLSNQQLENISDELSDELSEDFSFEIEEDLSTDQMDLGSEGQSSFVTDSLSSAFAFPELSLTEETDDALMDDEFNFDISVDAPNFNAFTNSLEEESPVDFSSNELVSDSELNESEDPQVHGSEAIWLTDAIASDLGEIPEIEEELADDYPSSVAGSAISTFTLPDLSLMEETDDALMDEMFDFGILDDSDNFGVSTNSLEEESPITFDEDLLNEPEADLSSVLSDNLEEGTDLTYDEFVSNSEANFDIDDNTPAFAELTRGLESDDESVKFSEIMDGENFADNAFDLEESVIFEAIADGANDLDAESAEDSLDLSISETSNFGLDSEFTESMPDLSLDFSDNWLDEVVEDSHVSSAKFADSDDDISIGYPSEDEVNAISDGDIYGFADNLLDSLMNEADEKFDSLSMDLPDLQTLPHLPNFNDESLEGEDINSELDSEPEFDFSAFDSIEDPINTARAEIDDFLSGSLDIKEEGIQKKNPTKPVEPDNSGSV